jgi:hypothetical protein
LNWWKNASKNVFYHCWGIVSLQQEVLIYGCLIKLMMFLLFFFPFWKALKPKQINIRLFEAPKIIKHALTISLTKLLDRYCLRKKIIAYVKYEGSNLNAMTNVLKHVVCY